MNKLTIKNSINNKFVNNLEKQFKMYCETNQCYCCNNCYKCMARQVYINGYRRKENEK